MKRPTLTVLSSAFLIGLALFLTGCPQSPAPTPSPTSSSTPPSSAAVPEAPPAPPTAEAQEVIDRLKAIPGATYKLDKTTGRLVAINIPDGSLLTPEDFPRFAKQTDLEELQIKQYRELNDSLAAELKPLSKLKSLGLVDCLVTDATAKMIAESFPDLTALDLSSNSLLTNATLAELAKLKKLQRLAVVQCSFDDIGALDFEKMTELTTLDIRGNMSILLGLDSIAKLPKLRALKHRSNAASDFCVEYLAASKSLDTLEIQDFDITDASGKHLNDIEKLTRLDLFRCTKFGPEGLRALKDKKLVRLRLRDMPMINDEGMALVTSMPTLRQLLLHELTSVTDAGLKDLGKLQNLELLDVWAVPVTNETIALAAKLPNLKSLSIRETKIDDAAIDMILSMPKLQELTIYDNAGITPDAVEALKKKGYKKLALSK